VEFLKSAKGKGMLGERAVRRGLTLNLDKDIYHILPDLLIPDGKGATTQIDHVIVSPFGLFVVNPGSGNSARKTVFPRCVSPSPHE
jgi:hypothetical protein